MSFAWPLVLWFLAAPLALIAWELTRARRSAEARYPKILRAEAGAQALRISPPGGERAKGRPARWWLAGGIALAILALARPQWGAVDEPVFGQSREILIALDLSRSMLTEDVKPSRLERAKLLTESLLDRLAGERVGLEIFAGTAFLQSPLSSDYDILREFLAPLGPEAMPVGGTDYAALIDTAAEAFSSASGPGLAADRYLVLLSDGGATDEGWQSHVGKLKALGVHVITLGIGTQSGALIPDGAGGFLKDEQGAVVKAALEDASLRELAERTGGIYRNASNWVDLPALLQSTVETGRRSTFQEKSRILRVERFQWALAPALLCLLVSFWLEFPVRPRPREMKLSGEASGGARENAEEASAFSQTRPHPEAAVPPLLAVSLLLLLSARARAYDAPPPDAPLARIVGRLSNQDACSPRDWSEMARETIDWGQHLQAAHQPMPAGPIGDALDAVDAGSRLNPALTDWRRLREELEALRVKPPEDKKNPPPKQQPKPQQQSQSQSQSQQQQQSQGGGQSQQSQPQSAFGDLKPPPPPGQPPQSGRQQVGGPSERQRAQSAPRDSSLAVPLEKLDQVRQEDSPGQLLRMLQNNDPHPAAKGKDW